MLVLVLAQLTWTGERGKDDMAGYGRTGQEGNWKWKWKWEWCESVWTLSSLSAARRACGLAVSADPSRAKVNTFFHDLAALQYAVNAPTTITRDGERGHRHRRESRNRISYRLWCRRGSSCCIGAPCTARRIHSTITLLWPCMNPALFGESMSSIGAGLFLFGNDNSDGAGARRAWD